MLENASPVRPSSGGRPTRVRLGSDGRSFRIRSAATNNPKYLSKKPNPRAQDRRLAVCAAFACCSCAAHRSRARCRPRGAVFAGSIFNPSPACARLAAFSNLIRSAITSPFRQPVSTAALVISAVRRAATMVSSLHACSPPSAFTNARSETARRIQRKDQARKW
jgi:hypothetical protein